MIRGHYRADCSLMFRLSKPRTEFFGHANLDSQMIPDSQQERQVAHMSSELATIRELSRSDSNRMLSTGTSTVARYPIRWLLLADYTVAGWDWPLSLRVNSTPQYEKTKLTTEHCSCLHACSSTL